MIKQTTSVATAEASVLSRIRPIEFDAADGIHILLYGQSGSGKTTLWATFPGKILSIICSGSNQPGELRSINTPEYRKKIDTVTLKSVSEMREIVDHIKATPAYQTVVLDHVTGLQDLTLKELLGLDELPAQKGWGLASQAQYGTSGGQCKEILRALLSLTCNVVIIAQERTFGIGEGEEVSAIKIPTVGAALTPSVTGWLNPACDYICRTFKRRRQVEQRMQVLGKEVVTMVPGEGVEFCLLTEPHELYTTKFRVPKGQKLPPVIVDPSYAKIMAIIKGV